MKKKNFFFKKKKKKKKSLVRVNGHTINVIKTDTRVRGSGKKKEKKKKLFESVDVHMKFSNIQ